MRQIRIPSGFGNQGEAPLGRLGVTSVAKGRRGSFECQNSVIVQEGGAAAGANRRIDHERNVAVFSEKTDYSLHQRRLRKHPCFCRADGKGGLNSVELVTQEGWIDGLKRSDLTRNLCNDRGDRAETVDSVRSKAFRSAWIPAPAEESDPAMVRARGGAVGKVLIGKWQLQGYDLAREPG